MTFDVPYLLAGGDPTQRGALPSLRVTEPAGVRACHPTRADSAERPPMTSAGLLAKSEAAFVRRIQAACAAFYKLDDVAEILRPSERPKSTGEQLARRSRARAVALYLSRVDTDFSIAHLATLFECTRPGARYGVCRVEQNEELREAAAAVRESMFVDV